MAPPRRVELVKPEDRFERSPENVLRKYRPTLLDMTAQPVRLRQGEAVAIDFRVDQNQCVRQGLVETSREEERETHLAQNVRQTQRADLWLGDEHRDL